MNNNSIKFKLSYIIGLLWVNIVFLSYYFYNAPYYLNKIKVFGSFILNYFN